MITLSRLTVMAASLFTTSLAVAGDATFHLDASLGARSDSNVALTNIDNLAGKSDTAMELEAGAGAKFKLGDAFRVELDYDYSATDYTELDAFDLDLHHARAAFGLQAGANDILLAVDRFEGMLDGKDYLTVQQVSPSVSRLFGDRVYVRAAYTNSDTRYATLDSRDATADAFRGDMYLLLNGMAHFVALTVEGKDEDAIDDAFDYDGLMSAVAWGYTFGEQQRSLSVRAQLRYEQRDYSQPLENDQKRVDDRWKMRISAELPITTMLSLSALAERTRNESVLATADLDRTMYGLEIGVQF